MKAPEAIYTLRSLVRDTIRQALSSGIFWLMLAVTVMCTLVCLSVSIRGDVPISVKGEEGIDAVNRDDYRKACGWIGSLFANAASPGTPGVLLLPPTVGSPQYVQYRQVAAAIREGIPIIQGEMSLGFGALPAIEINRGREDAVRTLQFQLVGWVADAFGLLLALVWTAGFLPTFLEPAAVTVLLAKPLPRWSLLTGKILGVLTFVGLQVFLFIGLTWLALGLRTGVWIANYWLCLPLLLIHFAVFYSFSAMLAVSTRSTVACVFGSIFFWLICWAMNFGRHSLWLNPELSELGGVSRFLAEAGYWILPKPLDFHFILMRAIGAETDYIDVLNLSRLEAAGGWMPGLSLLSSVVMGLLLLVGAAYEFITKDY
jgi:hypothetical protein